MMLDEQVRYCQLCNQPIMPNVSRTQIGPLQCIVVDGGPEGSTPTIPVVICHGYGASFEDLAPLAGEWCSFLGEKASQFRFVFPDAPHSLAELGMPQGRAWWPINMARMMEAVQASKFEELHEHQPPGIDDVRDTLCQTIEKVKADFGGETTPLVLGGFSQGAMLTMDVSLRGTIPPPACLFQFSGTIVCRPQWQAGLTRLAKTKVFQSHGTIDQILPFASATTLSEMLQESNVDIEFHSFVGPHTIDSDSIARTAQLLSELAS